MYVVKWTETEGVTGIETVGLLGSLSTRETVGPSCYDTPLSLTPGYHSHKGGVNLSSPLWGERFSFRLVRQVSDRVPLCTEYDEIK